MTCIFDELADITARIKDGQRGVDFLVVIDDSLGYEANAQAEK